MYLEMEIKQLVLQSCSSQNSESLGGFVQTKIAGP